MLKIILFIYYVRNKIYHYTDTNIHYKHKQ